VKRVASIKTTTSDSKQLLKKGDCAVSVIAFFVWGKANDAIASKLGSYRWPRSSVGAELARDDDATSADGTAGAQRSSACPRHDPRPKAD
jgi:hypothetical protein